MDPEEEQPTGSGPPPDPSLRSWRHPSEVAAGQRAAALPVSHEPYGLGDRWSLPSFVAGGAVGALLAVALVMSTGVMDRNDPTRIELREGIAAASVLASTTLTSPGGAAPSATAGTDTDEATLHEAVEGVVTVYQLDGVTPVGTAVHIGNRLVTSASAIGGAERLLIRHLDEMQEVQVRGRDQYTDIALLVPAEGDLLPIGSVPVAPRPAGIGQQVRLVTVDDQPQPIVLFGQIEGLDIEAFTRDGHLILDTVATNARLPELAAGALLVNDDGEAVGMVIDCADYVANAVPVQNVERIADSIADTGWGNAAWVGLLAANEDGAVVINEVVDDSPAAVAGLAAGDRVVAVDGLEVLNLSHFVMAIRRAGPGATITIDLDTDGHHWSTTMTVGERPPVPPDDLANDIEVPDN